MADRHEQAVRRDLAALAGDGVTQGDTGQLAVTDTQRLLDGGVGDELDVVLGAGVVDHDLRRAELVPPVHDGDLARELGQEAGLLHRRVAAADHHDLLLAEEGRVADRAVADAASLQRALALQPQLAGGRAGGHDHAVGQMHLVADLHAEGPLGEVDAGDVIGHQLGAEPLGLRAHRRHQLRAHDAVDEAGVVLDVAGDHQLAAEGEALEDEGAQVPARRVQRCGVAGRPSADDDHVANLGCHCCSCRFLGAVTALIQFNVLDPEIFPAAVAPDRPVGQPGSEEGSNRLPAEWTETHRWRR